VLNNGDRVVPEPLLLGRNDAKLISIAEDLGIDAYTTDYDSAIGSSEHALFFDAGTTVMRPELLDQALSKGKHLYCEKLVACSLSSARKLCARADAADVKAGVVMDKLFLPGLIKDRRVTCYEHVRNEVELAGGVYCTDQAVRDGMIVTAQTWQSHPEFYREVLRCLESPAGEHV